MTIPQAPLRRVFRVVNGGTPTAEPAHWNGGIPWATPIDIGAVNGGRLESTGRTITATGLRLGSRAVPAGSLIVSTRAPIGYVAEVDRTTAFNQGCRGLVARREVDTRYFRYQLLALATRLDSLGQGSTFRELSTDVLASTPLVVPLPREQRAIADFLDAETARIDAIVVLRDRQIALMRGRWREAVTAWVQSARFDRIPLGRFIRAISQGVSPVSEDRRVDPHEWGVLKLSAIKDGRFWPDEHKALDPAFDRSGHVEPTRGSLLVTRANTPALVGEACAVQDEPERLLLSDLIYRVDLDQTRMVPEFAAAVLGARQSRGQLTSAARGTSQSMVKLRGEDIRAVTIPVPPKGDQTHLVAAWRSERRAMDEIADRMRRQVQLLAEHRQALITAAVTGEIDVSTASGRGVPA